MEWKDLTIDQAQYIYEILKTDNPIDAEIKAFAYLTGTDEQEINTWGVEKYREEIKKIGFMFTPIPELNARQKLTINGKRYFISYKVEDVSFGQYNEVMEYSKGEAGIVKNLHKFMASIVTPVNFLGQRIKKKNHALISEDMKQAPFIHCYSAAVFFWEVYSNSLKAIQPYLKTELMRNGLKTAEAEETVEALLRVMDGFTPLKN